MLIDETLTPNELSGELDHFFSLAKGKVRRLNTAWDPAEGSPVFTWAGRYTSKGWTEWTQGFQFGCQILLFDATEEEEFLDMGRENTIRFMAPHVSHIGVHDHGFNNISTYGNLRRLLLEGRSLETKEALNFYDLAIKVSGAVQAARWTTIHDGTGFMHSFNGPHSLFSDTIRTCRILVLSHQLGHLLMGENDRRISLVGRAAEHAMNTIKFNVYFGTGRDAYDVPGRVVHEGIFNTNDGHYRCPSSQQGYSPFSTWTRGLAWVMLGSAELLESLAAVSTNDLEPHGGREIIEAELTRAARSTADFYIANTALDGIPLWDTGAPGVAHMTNYRERPSEPENPYEPFDSSAAAITAQGLLRLGKLLGEEEGARYRQAGLTTARALFQPPYISEDPRHHGLVLHSVYHRPKNWDYLPKGQSGPCGEATMWGDYHAMELAVYLQRLINDRPYLTFFDQAD
jgi:hypothetical protein